jgi:hypothetical protein
MAVLAVVLEVRLEQEREVLVTLVDTRHPKEITEVDLLVVQMEAVEAVAHLLLVEQRLLLEILVVMVALVRLHLFLEHL